MNVKSRLGKYSAILFVAVVVGIVSFRSGTGTILPTDYPVYFWAAAAAGDLFIYHPATRQIESVAIPWNPVHGITASADGRRIYLAAERSVIVLNTTTLSVVADLPYPPTGPVAVSPDNRLVAIMTDSLLVLRTDTYAVLFHHPTAVRQGAFSDDSRTLCCTAGDSADVVLVVGFDSDTPTVEQIPIEGGHPSKAIPVMNGRRILVYLTEQPMLSRLAVIDRLAGDEIYSEHIFPGEGDIISAAGWDRAIYTNSGSPRRIEGSSSFKIFAINDNQPIEEVNTRRHGSGSPHGFPVGPVQVTPDHRWLIALSATEPPQLLLYDLENEQFADWQLFGDDAQLRHLSVQLQP